MIIKNIKKIGIRKTYDISVDNIHNFFISNGILSHNSGKSYKMLATMQYYHSRGYKIFDFFGGKRFEEPFWCFPSDEKKLWKDFENAVGFMKDNGAKEYKVNLLYPMFKNQLPKKLPSSPPRVIPKVFTIPINSIDIQDISLVIGDVSKNSQHIWKEIQKECGKNGNLEDIKYIMNKKFKKKKELAIWHQFLEPLLEEELISSDIYSTNLDLIEECKSQEEISVLCHEFIPDKFRLFVMGWLRRNIFDLCIAGKISKKNIAMMREVSYFMKVRDKTALNAEQTQIFRNQLSDGARYGRSGFFLAMDTQSPDEVSGLIEGQDDFLAISEMPSQKDRDNICEPLRKDRRISKSQIRYITFIKPWESIIVTRGESAKLIKRFPPPRTMSWKPTTGTFFEVWKDKINTWIDLSEFTKHLNEMKLKPKFNQKEEIKEASEEVLENINDMNIPQDEKDRLISTFEESEKIKEIEELKKDISTGIRI